jgi:hypothetical protein
VLSDLTLAGPVLVSIQKTHTRSAEMKYLIILKELTASELISIAVIGLGIVTIGYNILA